MIDKNLIDWLYDLSKNLNDGYVLYPGDKRDTLIAFSPEMIEEVLVKKQKSFSRGIVFLKMKNYFREGLITIEGSKHLEDKRILQKSFHKNILNNLIEKIYQQSSNHLFNLNDKEFSLSRKSDEFSFDCVSKCLLNKNIPYESIDIVHKMSKVVVESDSINFTKDQMKEYEKIKVFAKETLKDIGDNDNFINNLIESGMDTEQIVDEIITMMSAGFETTSAAISWSIINLYNNQKFLKDLIQNQPQWVVENRPPSIDEIFSSEKVVNVIKETLRLNPPGYFTNRTASEDVDIFNVKVKSGTNVYISQYVTHRDEKYFKDSEVWNPNRWSNNFEKTLPRGAYFPFGLGSKKCIGENFAIITTIIFISMFTNKYDYSIIDKNINPKYLVSMIPDSDVYVKTKVRK